MNLELEILSIRINGLVMAESVKIVITRRILKPDMVVSAYRRSPQKSTSFFQQYCIVNSVKFYLFPLLQPPFHCVDSFWLSFRVLTFVQSI